MQLVAFYLYDVHDRRVVRMVMGTWDTRFTAWDGWQEAQELSLGGTAQAVPEKQFLWGEQLDELVAYRTKTAGVWNEYYVAEGGAHCPQRILNSSGAVVEAQEYDPYGKTSFFGAAGNSAVSQVGNPFGWKAVRIDPETGLLYMRHRYYSTQWGRFLTQDPLGVWGDPAQLGGAYNYGSCCPTGFGDPFGLQVSGRTGTYRFDSASGQFLQNGQLGMPSGGGVSPVGGVGANPSSPPNPRDGWGAINRAFDASVGNPLSVDASDVDVSSLGLKQYDADSGTWRDLTEEETEWVNDQLLEFRSAAAATVAAMGRETGVLSGMAALSWLSFLARLGCNREHR
ncbi:MAG: RHS repeat-associated core domain-containing protein [Planctomycetes bacterium]|nr:RHS repeat-associated core domain-containing protein [Planctomycetota bacterium]